MYLILNEIKYAKNILESGEIGSKPSATLYLLGKYYRNHLNLTKEDTAKLLDEFMSKNYKNYNRVLWEDIIDNISFNSNKYQLRCIEKVGITKSELEYIKRLNNIDCEKLVFAMLCYAKAHNITNEKNNNWVNCSIAELFKTARINVKYKNDKMFMLNRIKNTLLIDVEKENNEIVKESLISFSQKNNNKNIKLNFIDDSKDYVLFISDFRELGYEYLLYLGENYSRCETCRILYKQNKTKTNKYCMKHRGYQVIGTKTISCIECGCDVEVNACDMKSCRCEECQHIENNRIKLEYYHKTKQLKKS
jgi:hypothetical protein